MDDSFLGINIKVVTIALLTTTICYTSPLQAQQLIANNTTQTANGTYSTTIAGQYALYALNNGQINSTGPVTVSTTGASTYAAYATTGGQINLTNGGLINTSGASSDALFSNGIISAITTFGMGITTSGSGTNGALAYAGGKITINNSTITTSGLSSRGLQANLSDSSTSPTHSEIDATNVTITTTGDSGHGVVSTNGGLINLNTVDVNTSGAASFGLFIEGYLVFGMSPIQTEINGTNVIINTSGNMSFGAVDIGSGTLNLTDSSVTTTGPSAGGIFVSDPGSVATITRTPVTSTQYDAAQVENTGALHVIDSTWSGGRYGITSIGGFPGIPNIVTFNGGSLTSALDALHSNNTIETISLTNTTITPQNNVFVNVTTTNPSTVTSNVELTASNAIATGNAIADATSILDMSLTNRTNWTGASLNATNIAVDQTSVWNLNANSTISNQLLNAGLIDYVSEGNIFKTLTVSGSYIGQNGIIGLNTFLGTDGSPSDLLIINDGTASGSTGLNIKNTTGGGDLTVANGILVVEAINGGTTDLGAFSLANPVIAGPYEYSLFRGSVDPSGSDNWYLRSTIASPSGLPTPNYRQEVSLYTALPSMVLLYERALMDTLHQRVGEEEQLRCQCRCDSEDFFNGVWVRVINEGGNQRGRNIFHHGPNFHYHMFAVQAGMDVYRCQYSDGSRDHLGVLGAIGRGHGKVRHFTHITAGRNKFDAYTGGFYCTHFGPSGWYVDGLVELNWYDQVRAHSTRHIPRLKTHGTGVATSLEGGYPLRIFCFTVEPQAQIIYQRIRLHHSHDIAAQVNFKRTNSTAGRLGVRLVNTWDWGPWISTQPRLFTAWLRTSFWDEFQGKSRTFFSSDAGPIGFHSKLRGVWFQGDLGFTGQITDILSLYGSFGGNVYLNGRGQAYNAVVGLRANF